MGRGKVPFFSDPTEYAHRTSGDIILVAIDKVWVGVVGVHTNKSRVMHSVENGRRCSQYRLEIAFRAENMHVPPLRRNDKHQRRDAYPPETEDSGGHICLELLTERVGWFYTVRPGNI